MAYRIAPHVPLLIVKDRDGRLHHQYHHNTGVIHWLNDEQRESFLRNGLVIEIPDEAPADVPAAAPSAGSKPAKTAPEKAWVDYGVSQGQDRAELEALSKPELVDLLG